MYLITGATGNVGSALVTLLHEQGHRVRALVRDPSRAERLPDGIDIAVGDLDDVDSLTAAASGVEGMFYMQVNPGTTPTENIVAAARAADVPRIVALSSIGVRLEPVDHPMRDGVKHGMRADRADALRQLNEIFRAGRAGVVTDERKRLARARCGRFEHRNVRAALGDDSAPRAYAVATTSPTSTLSKVINSPGG